MFVCAARLVFDVPANGSLKAKRQLVRRMVDRIQARFNVAIAEVEDVETSSRATLGLCVVGNDQPHVNQQMDKIIHFAEEMYVAPMVSREIEMINLGHKLWNGGEMGLPITSGMRSLAEAEGATAWDGVKAKEEKELSLDEARAKARTLRNLREWEKK